jgi:hypothetical protein
MTVERFPQRDTDASSRIQHDARLAAGFREIEGDVCDLARMGDVAAILAAEADGRDPMGVEVELATFAVHHLNEMLQNFRKKYFALYEGDAA